MSGPELHIDRGETVALSRLRRPLTAVVGGLVVILGLVLVPLPGPGWLIVFTGLGLLGREFAWAARMHVWVRARVHACVNRVSWSRRRLADVPVEHRSVGV